MNPLWIGAALFSLVAHAAVAVWIDGREPDRPAVIVERVEMELAQLPAPPLPQPPPPPKKIEEPPPPPKPIEVKRVAKLPPRPAAAPAPPPPPTPKIGVDATQTGGDVQVAQGSTLDGEIGTGTSPDPTPAPPAPPPPPPQPLAPPAPLAKKFVPIYEVTQLPRPVRPVQPDVPEAFRQANREALVVVEVEIDARGRVTGARVMRHAEFGLDEAALAAARATEFEPARMGTQPVAVRYQMPYRFKVRG